MTRPTIQDYEEASGLDFSLKSIRAKFQEQLYAHGIPETNIKLVSAKENQDYLGQYRASSQFRSGTTFQIHIDNHFKVMEDEFISMEKDFSDRDVSVDTLTNDEKKLIAENTMVGLSQTLWHEYAHAIYEYFKEEDPENTFYKEVRKFFNCDEEEFTESMGRLYAGTNYDELNKIAKMPLAVEEAIITNAVYEFTAMNFFPEDIEDCKNPERLQHFVKRNFLLGFQEEHKYSIEDGKYDKKVHETYLKNEIRILKDRFDIPLEIIHIKTDERGNYPLIKIGNKNNNESNFLFIDSVNPESRLNLDVESYGIDDISAKIVKKSKATPG